MQRVRAHSFRVSADRHRVGIALLLGGTVVRRYTVLERLCQKQYSTVIFSVWHLECSCACKLGDRSNLSEDCTLEFTLGRKPGQQVVSTPPTSFFVHAMPSGQTYFLLKPSTTTSFTSSAGKKHLYDAEGRSLVDLDKKMVSLHGTWLLTRSADGSRIAEVKPSKKSEYMCCTAAVLCTPPPLALCGRTRPWS